jgi:hypothetical protein
MQPRSKRSIPNTNLPEQPKVKSDAKIASLFLLAVLAVAFTQPVSADQSPFLGAHCFGCHDPETKSGGLDLTTLQADVDDPVAFAKWVKVHDRVASGEMPPRDEPRPDAAESKRFLTELDQRLAAADRRRQSREGRIRLRRMTRREFENTLSDLLALPRLDIIGLLPADGRVAGYDKIAGGLDLSPAHLAAYTEAIETALDLAIATRATPPPVFKRRVYPAGLFKFRANLHQGQFVLLKDKLPDPTYPPRGGYEEVKGHIAADDADADLPERQALYERNEVAKSEGAVGLLNPNLAGYEAAMNVAPIYGGTYTLRLSLWGFDWNAGRVEAGPDQAAVLRAHAEGKQQEGGRLLGIFTAPSLRSNVAELTTWIDPLESIVFDPVSLYWMGLRVGQIGGRSANYVGPGVAIDWFEIEGPLNQSWPPESHKCLFGDLPIRRYRGQEEGIAPRRQAVRGLGGYLPNFYVDLSPKDRDPPLESVHSERPVEDARDLLTRFLPKAFRRDVGPEEVEPYVELFRERLAANDCFEDAMRRVYVAILTSPEFLFHLPDGDEGTRFELASRLSYWLWNGPPDDELLRLARDGALGDAKVLLGQVDRMLSDPRWERFVVDFTDQWLELARINETTPDPLLYPEYRFLLHEGMLAETRAFVREVIREDLPIETLVRPGFAMLTQRLAEHYGIEGVRGVEVRKVLLPGSGLRGGVLGQAAIHKLTANGTTTTPVKRGVWVMDRLLDSPAPPPPPGISAIDPDTRGTTTVREQLDRHRADAACAACHEKIDPPGFALESFDPIGGFRTRYRSTGQGDEPPEKGTALWKVRYKYGPAVDASGVFADGSRFGGLDDFTLRLAHDPERLAKAFVAHLSRYATGADTSYADRAEISRIVASTQGSRFGIRSLIHALAISPIFIPEKAVAEEVHLPPSNDRPIDQAGPAGPK